MVTKLSLKARALRYLAGREHSRPELKKKLSRYAETETELETLLDWLEQRSYLSCQRFAESLLHRMQSRYGSQRILYELNQHALDHELLASCRESLRENEHERGQAILCRKFAPQPMTPELKAKMYRFLVLRGFSPSVAQLAIKSWIAENPDVNDR